MAAFDQSFDPTVYAQVLFDITKAKQFIKQMSEKTGKKITLTVFWIKVVGEVFKRLPECNEMIRFGIKVKREEVDIGVLVNVGDKDLANMTIRNVPGKTMSEISDELYREADIYRKEKNKTHNNGLRALRKLPSLYFIIFLLFFFSLIEILLELDGILANMGINCKALGVKNIFFYIFSFLTIYFFILQVAKNQYGSVIITSLGGFHLKNVYVPLCPFTQTSGVFANCEIKKKKILNKDGTFTETEYLPVNFTLDHRFIDGVLSAKMVKEGKKLFDNPESFSVY